MNSQALDEETLVADPDDERPPTAAFAVPESGEADVLPSWTGGDEADGALGEELLAAARLDVERLLQAMPSALLEAKKFIAAELWQAPRPEELQTIVKLATDRSLGARCADLARTILALRLVAEREARSFWDELPLDPDEIRLRARRLAGVAHSAAAFGDPSRLNWDGGRGLDSDDRELVGKMARTLLPRPDRLVAATVLAPRLALLAEKQSDGLEEILPSITREEARILGGSVAGADELAIDLRRACLHVAAARWLMHDDLFEWDALSPEGQEAVAAKASSEPKQPAASSGESTGADEPAGHGMALDEARRSKLSECLLRLREDELVYRAVSAQVQTLQDRTLKVHRKDLTDLLIRLRRPLLASYTRLAVILRSPTAADLAHGPGAAARHAEAKAAEVLRAAEAETVEKAIDEAITSLKSKPSRFLGRLTPALKARRRMIALVSTLVVVVAAALIVLWYLPPAPDPPLAFDVGDCVQLKLAFATPIGTMLYAQVDDYWNRLTPDQRREKLDDLARAATGKGFHSLLLTDLRGEVLGRWDIARGSSLGDTVPGS